MSGSTGSWGDPDAQHGASGEWQRDPTAWTQLSSSNLKAFKYDPRFQKLTVSFKSGRVYSYDSVPEDIANGLASAASAGKYFDANIKNAYTTHRQ